MTARERRPSGVLAVALGLAITFVSPHARADDDEIDVTTLRVEKLADDAFARASRGAYAEAVELYLQANEAAPSAALAFDIAWLYDKHLGAPALALDWYRRALAAPDVTPELTARARERAAALESSNTAAARAVGAVPPASEGAGKGGAGSSWSPQRTWAILAGGTGLVALGVGTAFAIVAKNKDDQAGRYCDGDRCTDARALTLTDEATSAATVADVAIVTGAIFLATGVTLWLLAPRRGGIDVSVRAVAGRSAAGASLAPTFVLGGALP